MDIEKTIRNLALQNAIKFKGKANPGALIGTLLRDFPEYREKTKELAQKVNPIVQEVNALSLDEQKSELQQNAPELLEQKKQEKKPALPDLNQKNIVMRFAPSPSGPLHIGHAYVLSLNYELCKKHSGTLYIRIDDTNPENSIKESYDMIEQDAQWLTENGVKQVFCQSENLETYYKYAKILIEKGHAYVCEDSGDEYREKLKNKQVPEGRDLSPKEQLERFEKLFTNYQEGDAVLRIKTDLNHKNPAMIDWPAMRIKEATHPRTGESHRVWPLLNFAVAIDDHETRITHAIRAKDHIDNEKRQQYIYDFMGWTMPQHLYVGRINFKDLKVSSTETRKAIEQGQYEGWDDIRLPTLKALRKRGYQPQSLRKYALSVGLTQNDKQVEGKEFFKTINAFNKELIDDKSDRYFFIKDPVEIKIENAPERTIELDLHPDHKKGGRKLETSQSYILANDDVQRFKEKTHIRLIENLNFEKNNDQYSYISDSYEEYKEKGSAIIHWLPKATIPMQVQMPDGSFAKGLGEENIKNCKQGQIIQCERFGFVKLEKIENNKIEALYLHS